jgi:hypothetical protein
MSRLFSEQAKLRAEELSLSGCDWRIPKWISGTEKSGQRIDYAQIIRDIRNGLFIADSSS